MNLPDIDPIALTDERLRRQMSPDEYARFQQFKFLRMVFAKPEFADVLRGATIKYLRRTGEPHLRVVADYIEREKVNVADALAEQSLGTPAPRVYPGGADGGRGDPPPPADPA